jgi:hypothetical protein
MAWLAGTANFPTFFRHARSKTHIVVSLALILLFHAFFQISTIFYSVDVFSMKTFATNQNYIILTLILSVGFSMIALVCMNLINVYFISACWEIFFPRDLGPKKYIICSILGTATYLYLEITNKGGLIFFAENAITYSMVILVLALLINFLISTVVKHRLRSLKCFLGSSSWIIGCAITIRPLIQSPEKSNSALFSGILAAVLFSIFFILVEETVWSIRTILNKKKS